MSTKYALIDDLEKLASKLEEAAKNGDVELDGESKTASTSESAGNAYINGLVEKLGL